MSTKIVSQFNQEILLQLIRDEATVNESGQSFFSRRGIARLTGKSLSVVQRLLGKLVSDPQRIPEMLKSFAGSEFSPTQSIPDTLVTAIISHYANQGDAHCFKLLVALSAVGLRGLTQKVHNWTQVELTPEQVVAMLTQETAQRWTCRFQPEFYTQLARLTGLFQEGHKRPMLWAQLTRELVYDYMPIGVADAMRKTRAAEESWEKLHQFLSDEGLRVLEEHLSLVLTLMQASASIATLKEALASHSTRTYQLRLAIAR